MLEPHRTHASLWPNTWSLCTVAQAGLVGLKHNELMRACGLILALVVLCCSSSFSMVEPTELMQTTGLILALVMFCCSSKFGRV